MSTCGILFDFDGTLANTTPLILATFHKTLGHFAPGKTFSDQDIINTFGLPLRQGLAELTGQYQEETIDKMTEYYRHFNFAWHDRMIRPFPGVKEGLAALSDAHVPMVIVTRNARPTSRIRNPWKRVWHFWGFRRTGACAWGTAPTT